MTTPCKCAAHNSDECVCGAWDDLDPYMLTRKLKAAQRTIERLENELRDSQILARRLDERNARLLMFGERESDDGEPSKAAERKMREES